LPGRYLILDKKVGVLEVAEVAEIDGQGHPQLPILPRFVGRRFSADADEEVNDGGEGN
jgi:pyrimidine operon attenuation protein/uracil phosphoribosyltransferase